MEKGWKVPRMASWRRVCLFGSLAAGLCGLSVLPSCGAIPGIVSPDRIESRGLELWNRSKGYVVFRVSTEAGEPVVSDALPPGGEFNGEMVELFGDLCPAWIRIEVFAYRRADAGVSPLVDETLDGQPVGSAVVELEATRDYGCRADLAVISLDSLISCDVLEVDESAGRIGLDVNGSVQVQEGLNAANPPVPRSPEHFAFRGRVVNLDAEAIAGAEIRLADLDEVVYTDAEGRFEVLRPEGAYHVEAVVAGVDVTPAGRRFAHREVSDVPIEFIAQTHDVPALAAEE